MTIIEQRKTDHTAWFGDIGDPELFALELDTLAQVREETPNQHLMIPSMRARWELEACLGAISRADRRMLLSAARGARA